MNSSNWGDQFGSLAMGIGAGAADYELAKHDPKGYVSLQKWGIILFLVLLIGVGVVALVTLANNRKHAQNEQNGVHIVRG